MEKVFNFAMIVSGVDPSEKIVLENVKTFVFNEQVILEVTQKARDFPTAVHGVKEVVERQLKGKVEQVWV